MSEYRVIAFRAYRDPAGEPTCGNGDGTCVMVRVSRFGTLHSCALSGVEIPANHTYLRPLQECPAIAEHPAEVARQRHIYKEADQAMQEQASDYKAERDEARSALRLIAAPKRPDGTWNRDREACRQLAAFALDGK